MVTDIEIAIRTIKMFNFIVAPFLIIIRFDF